MLDLAKDKIQDLDERRDVIIPGDKDNTIQYSVEHFITIANQSIQEKNFFTVALSGGSTPKAIFSLLAEPENASKIDWGKVFIFWSDERSVPSDHPENNFFMAMNSGLSSLEIPTSNIHRMSADFDIEKNTKVYEELIHQYVPNQQFDLITLGMGEDGHTASLFPHTKALTETERLVVANYVPQKETYRMTLTYTCINQAKNICFYVIGPSKQITLAKVLLSDYQPEIFPAQKIGLKDHRALWIVDLDAAKKLG